MKFGGILIKGAPSQGTKFNPQFRKSGAKPISRGLTQGKILQIASHAVAVMNSPHTKRRPKTQGESIRLQGFTK